MVRIHPDPPKSCGAVAQLGERLLCKQEVVGSIPSSSTSQPPQAARFAVLSVARHNVQHCAVPVRRTGLHVSAQC